MLKSHEVIYMQFLELFKIKQARVVGVSGVPLTSFVQNLVEFQPYLV